MGDEPRQINGVTLDPKLTGRGWCDVCDGPTARRGLDGRWRHGWCDVGTSIATYLARIVQRRGR